ncbi:GAP family protein [Mycobacterium sp.]|uniref:GAP family protein n=1 Tax=Mycobacterium sp. TaxID=1785 RepID=UPI003A8A062F
MWTLLLVVGLGMAIDPVRVGLAVAMLSQRRPFRNLLAFWLGGIAAGVGIGLAAFVLLREITLGVLQATGDAITRARSATVILDGGRLQLTFGVLALLMVAVITKRANAPVNAKVHAGGGHTVTLVEERPDSFLERLGQRTHQLFSGDRTSLAFFAGLSTTFPPYEGLVVLAFIGASGYSVTEQFSVFLLFILMILALIEIPLVCFLTAPEKTEAVMERIQDWVRTYRLQITQVMFTFVGVTLLYQGIAAL